MTAFAPPTISLEAALKGDPIPATIRFGGRGADAESMTREGEPLRLTGEERSILAEALTSEEWAEGTRLYATGERGMPQLDGARRRGVPGLVVCEPGAEPRNLAIKRRSTSHRGWHLAPPESARRAAQTAAEHEAKDATPPGVAALRAVEKARLRRTAAETEALDAERDLRDAVRVALEHASVADVAHYAQLSTSRIYQIRDGRR